jgi:hypothetical protein
MEKNKMKKMYITRIMGIMALAAMTLAACAPATSSSAETTDSLPQTVAPVETTAPVETATSDVAGTEEIELIGTIESMSPTAWTLNGQILAILPTTEIKGSFLVGDLVKAHAAVQADNSLAAREIEPVAGSESASLNTIGAEYDFTGAIDAMAVDQWTVAGTTFGVTPQTEIKGTFAIGELAKVHVLVNSDGSLVAREIEAPDAELAAAGEGTEVELVELIESISPEAWVVGGQTLVITPSTEIKGTFTLGDAVKVHVLVGSGGLLTAREIEAAEVGQVGVSSDDNTNTNSNLNSNTNANDNANGNANGNDNSGKGNDNGGNGNDNSGKGNDNGG